MVISSKYTAPKDNGTFVLTIPTKTGSPNPAQDRQIDLSQMDEQDLKSLQKCGEQPCVMRDMHLCSASTLLEPT